MIKTIDRDDLLQLMNFGVSFKLVDVLSRESFENEHIKGAISLPLAQIENGDINNLNKDDVIITYCAGFDCPASTNAAKKLISLGFITVLDYKGGLKDYKTGNFPLEGNMRLEAAKAKSGN